MVVSDLNLLVYAFNASAPRHEAAAAWWEGLLNGDTLVGVPWVVVLGFLRLMTGRHVVVDPYPPDEALAIVRGWFERPNVRLLPATAETLRLLEQLVARHRLSGSMITDAAIAACALEHRAVVHTNDTDFLRFGEVRVHDPLAG